MPGGVGIYGFNRVFGLAMEYMICIWVRDRKENTGENEDGEVEVWMSAMLVHAMNIRACVCMYEYAACCAGCGTLGVAGLHLQCFVCKSAQRLSEKDQLANIQEHYDIYTN